MRRAMTIVLLMIPVRLAAPLVCYNTDCLPAVARVDAHAAPFPCPPEFRAKNYAKSNDAHTWKTVCAASGNFIYGGLSFYEGEGITGTGGLLRLDATTRAVEVRRLKMLRDVSIHSIAADGDVVWSGTTREEECVGDPFVHGLVRYDWQSGAIKTWEGSDDGPIGFSINDIALRDSSLWVATDLGLSRLDLSDGTWHYFNAAGQQRSAKEIIEPLLRRVPRDCLRSDVFENELIEGLVKFRPRLLKAYLNSVPVAKWECTELRFMTAQIRDFETLNRRVLRFHSPHSDNFLCAVEGFSTHKHVERAWRQLLVSSLRQVHVRYQSVIVHALETATGKRIFPDGHVEKVPRSSIDRFRDRIWSKWSREQRDAVVAAWSKLILPPHGR